MQLKTQNSKLKTQNFHGGNVYEFARRRGISPSDVLDFSASINPYGPPVEVLEFLRQDLSPRLRHYPDPSAAVLREKLSSRWKIPPDHFVVGNGANELIPLIIEAVSPRRIHIPIPNFGSYFKTSFPTETHLFFDEDGVKENWPERLLSTVGRDDLLLLSNPNNPTGSLLTAKEKSQLLAASLETGFWLMVDEAFMDFLIEDPTESLILKVPQHKRLTVLRSMTKFYAIPGLRLGYGVGPAEMMKKVSEMKDPWSVNGLAQKAGEICLSLPGFDDDCRINIQKDREVLLTGLQQLDWLKSFPSAANFLLVRLESSYTAAHVQNVLDEANMMIRDCSSFQGLSTHWVRLAVRTVEDQARLISRLKDLQ